MRRAALISEHASPCALLGGADAGGQNVYVDAIARALASRGWEVDVFTRRDAADLAPAVRLAPGVRVIHVPAGPPRAIPKDDIWPHMPRFRDEVLRFMRRERYDVVHGNFWMSGWAAVRVGRTLGIPVVQLFHALGTTKRRYQGAADTSPSERIAVEREVAQAADLVLAVCPSEEEQLVEEYGVPRDRIEVVPLGVDLERFRPASRVVARARIGIRPARPLVVYVGRMLERKDVRNVVRAIGVMRRALPDRSVPRLVVVGGESADPDPATTPEIGAVLAVAREEGVADLVRCVGMRQPQELRWWYAAADAVATTPWYEPFGLTPLEAMACGRPVLGSAVGGITYTVRCGETGLLVPPRDPESAARALAWLLADEGRRDRMGRAARARVEALFRWDTVCERTIAAYDRARALAGTLEEVAAGA